MKVIICDRCKALPKESLGQVYYHHYFVEIGKHPILGSQKEVDLCAKCISEFIDFVK